MRGLKLAAALALSTLAAGPSWATGQVETGRQIVAACKAYLALPADAAENALHPQHHCRQFIASYLSAYAAGESASTDSAVTGSGSLAKKACVRLPAYLSFRDMAARMVAYADSDPSALDNLATELARKTLEHDFPCEHK
jgi:hypothetical protein